MNNIVDNGKDVIPTPPPTPTQTPASTPTTTLETEDVDLNAQSAEDMRMESLATESPGMCTHRLLNYSNVSSPHLGGKHPAKNKCCKVHRAATRHGAGDPLVRPQVDQTYNRQAR